MVSPLRGGWGAAAPQTGVWGGVAAPNKAGGLGGNSPPWQNKTNELKGHRLVLGWSVHLQLWGTKNKSTKIDEAKRTKTKPREDT